MVMNPFFRWFFYICTGDGPDGCTRNSGMWHDELHLNLGFKTIWYGVVSSQLQAQCKVVALIGA